MHTLLPDSRDDLVALRLSGKLDAADYDSIKALLESRIAEQGKVRLYWEMVDFDGWTPQGLWADARLDVKHANHFSKIAIVGTSDWEKWTTKLMKPFTSAEVKFFPLDQSTQALAWAKA
ncbi:MAG: STAS/SEC14 domain-containing protein [Verrucomicrobiota bacterium JB022]|nr:STAS/SEC14 domain-containing protein [Verrucomicrobiota bacterium JB022]